MAWRDTTVIRPATAEDVTSILWMVQLLAEYEREPNAVAIGQEELLRDGFGPEKYFDVLIAELNSSPPATTNAASPDLPSSKMVKNERIVGFALYFFYYCPLQGKVLYLEDLCIREEYRNAGLGTALMQECAKVAKARDCIGMAWQVLDWNTKAIALYERVGGKCLKELITLRMDKKGIENFAHSCPGHLEGFTTWRDTIDIRPATAEDLSSILWMVQLLAEFEHDSREKKIGEKELLRDGFGPKKYFNVLIAKLKSPPLATSTAASPDLSSSKMVRNEQVVGYALYFFHFSTWEGRVLYLKDLFVREEYRNMGLGTALIRECAKVAKAKDCARMTWQVLDWNTKAIALYKRVGGKCLREWITVRMDEEGIEDFQNN